VTNFDGFFDDVVVCGDAGAVSDEEAGSGSQFISVWGYR
jgi:hypothetical protein